MIEAPGRTGRSRPALIALGATAASGLVLLLSLRPGNTAPRAVGGSPASPHLSGDPLDVEEVVNYVSLPGVHTPLQVSPEGDRVAYTVEFATRTMGQSPRQRHGTTPVHTRVRVTRTATGETRPVMEAPGSSWGPAWSPGGDRLAFFSDRGGAPQLWVWDRETGRSRRVSEEVVWTAWTRNHPRWTPDGKTLLVKILPAGRSFTEMRRLARRSPAPADTSDTGTTARVFHSEGGDEEAAARGLRWLRGEYGGDLAAIDRETGEVRRLTRGLVPVWWNVSPDGDVLAFTHFVDPERPELGFRLSTVPAAGGEIRELPGTIHQTWGEAVSWAPRGARLAYISRGRGEEGGIFVVDAAEGSRRRHGEAGRGWGQQFRGPVWSADARTLYFTGEDALWTVEVETGRRRSVAQLEDRSALNVIARGDRVAWSPHPGTVVVRTRDPTTRRMGFARVDVATGRVTGPAEEEGVFGGPANTDVSRDGTAAVVLYSESRHPPDLWLLGDALERTRKLTSMNPSLRPDRLGESRLVEWEAEDGERLGGTLLLPPDRVEGAPLPLVVEVYGGRRPSREIHRFDRHRQLLASRGYGVLAPDLPLERESPMRSHARSVVPAVERLIDLGVADPERIGLTGHSYGGYGTLALLAGSELFAAAVASASQGNLVGSFAHLNDDGTTSTVWAERGQGRMGGPPWEIPDRYVENSPLFFMDRVEAPLLLLHGAEDRNTPAYLAGQIFVALQRLDRTATFVRYEGEGHWPESWSAANHIDYWTRILGWFDEHL